MGQTEELSKDWKSGALAVTAAQGEVLAMSVTAEGFPLALRY